MTLPPSTQDQTTGLTVLDLFSAAAGGWSLGLHRAGFVTLAACEAVDWRRALYASNNPGVPIYDDVRTLTAARLVSDLGRLPDIIVGSPPCQDISSANTKGKGVEGERSGLYHEAVRLVGECRPRWYAFENSSNLRTRGADTIIPALEALGYTCWPFVVRASDIRANHERPRSWLIGCDLDQVADADRNRWTDGRSWGRSGFDLPLSDDPFHPARLGHEGGRTWRRGPHGNGAAYAGNASEDGCGQGLSWGHQGATGRAGEPPCWDAADAHEGSIRQPELPGRPEPQAPVAGDADPGASANAPQVGQQGVAGHPRSEWQGEVAQQTNIPSRSEVGLCAPNQPGSHGSWPLWSLEDLAGRIRLDDGLPARVAGTRIAVGGPRGTAAASLIVEAYGDAVVPQIPEAIGRAILRVEAAMHTLSKAA